MYVFRWSPHPHWTKAAPIKSGEINYIIMNKNLLKLKNNLHPNIYFIPVYNVHSLSQK